MVGGGAFIVTLLFLAMLILVVDPADVAKTVDRPVLFDPESSDEPDSDKPDRTSSSS